MKITLKDVSMSKKDKKILDHINLCIEEGQAVAILGPNGAGKTSLVHVMLKLNKVKEGLIENDFETLKPYEIGVHLQECKLNGLMKVKEIVKLFSFNKNTENLLEKYNLDDKLNQRIATLSGGEKQKLQLILAVQNNPKIIFLDEITTGLDVESRNNILNFLKNEVHKKGKTLVMVMHYLEEAEQLCDYYIFMKKGRIIERGNKEELYKKYDIKKYICIEFNHKIIEPVDFTYEEIDNTKIKIKLHEENDLANIMSFMHENSLNIKNYSIFEPSLENLYSCIMEEKSI